MDQSKHTELLAPLILRGVESKTMILKLGQLTGPL